MPRPKGSFKDFPAYRRHTVSGQAIVTLSGETHYLGEFGSAASRAKYDRLVGEWIANGRQALRADVPTVTEVIAGFWAHAKTYYVNPDGTPAGELDNYRWALKPLKRVYGEKLAVEFGPLALRALMGEMVKLGWSRTYINRQTARLKQVFKWAVGNELIPSSVYQSLAAVAGYRKNRSPARETVPVRPVPDADVAAVLGRVSRQVEAMINLQLLTGMRPGEVCIMRGADIDTTGEVWTYKPSKHKKEHLDMERVIDLGPKAKAIIKPFLRPDVNAFLFSPAEAEADRLATLRQNRKSKVTPSQLARSEKAARRIRRRPPRGCFTVRTYRRAICRACEQVFGMPKDLDAAGRNEWRAAHVWHPHQLRHNAATRLRKEFGLEIARIVLGHESASMTAHYAEKDRQKAREAMALVG